MQNRKILNSIILHTVLIIGSIVMLVPFLWMVLTAFKTISESTQMNPFVIFPTQWRTDAFESVMTKMNFGRLYWNTFVLMLGRVFFAVITATLGGYAFGRLRFKGNDL